MNKTILFRLSRLLSSEEGYHASESSVIRLSRRPWLSHQQRLSHLQSYHAHIIQSSTTSGYHTRRHTLSFRCPGAVVFVFIFVVFLDPRAQSTNLHNTHDVVQSRHFRALSTIYSSVGAKQRYSGNDFDIVCSKRVMVGCVGYGSRDMPPPLFFPCALFLAGWWWRTTTWMRPRRRLQRRLARTRFARIGSSVAHLTSMLSPSCDRR